MAKDKLNLLRDILRGYESCLVAYSGGVDSVLLAHVAHEVLAGRMLAVLADSPSLPRRELAEARAEAHAQREELSSYRSARARAPPRSRPPWRSGWYQQHPTQSHSPVC